MELKLPETLVLFATVHGVIPVEDEVERLFTVPRGMKITRIMAARPGVCNLTQGEQIDAIVKDMNKVFKVDITPAGIDSIIETIKPTNRELVRGLPASIKTETDDENRALFEQYVRSHVKSPEVREFPAGANIINKYMAREAKEGVGSAYDFKLNLINVRGNPDLFDLMVFGTAGPSVGLRKYAKAGRGEDFSSLVKLMKDNGVKHLVLFDFTCSSFEGVVTDRDERALRRDMIQRGVGKRKTRRTKTKTKTRKQKKRRALWSH